MKTQVIAETKKFEEAKQTQEVAEIHNQNTKKIKKMNSQMRDKEAQLDNSNDRANELSNKLNDVQAAAYFKDKQIKKMSLEEATLKQTIAKDESDLKSNIT